MSTMFATVTAAALRLGVHPKTVLRFIREGRLAATRIGKSYRILSADLDAFAGAPASMPAGATPADRVTAIADLADISPDMSTRIVNALNSAVMSRGSEPTRIQLDTAYDPARRDLKVVIIASPRDAAGVLQILQAVLEAVR